MSYQSGTMGVASGVALVFAVIIPRVFLTTAAATLPEVGPAGWLVPAIFGVYTLIMLWGLFFVAERVPGDLFAIFQYLVGRWGAFLIAAFLSFFSFANVIVLLRQYTENTLITALPEANFNIVLLTYLVTIGIIVYFGIEVISQGAYLLMPFIFLGLTITMVLLNGYWDKHNLLPWLGNGIPKLLKTSILTTGSNMESFLLVIIAPAFKNMKTIKTAAIFGVGGATVVKTAFTMIFLLTFDVEPGLEKILPFYEMARLIYISRYVQRVEALLIILWVIAGLIAISISLYIGLYLLTQIFNLSALRLLVPAVCLVLLQLVLLPKSVDDIQKLDMILLRIGDVGIYVIPLLLIVATLLKGKRVKTCTGD